MTFWIFFLVAIYPVVALGRIWLYSKKQLEELKLIRASLDRLNTTPK